MLKRRTDLALEAAQLWQESAGEAGTLPGVESEEATREGYPVTTVRIRDEAGARALGKPVGTYVTLELDGLARREEDAFGRAARALAAELGALLGLAPGAPQQAAQSAGGQLFQKTLVRHVVFSLVISGQHQAVRRQRQPGRSAAHGPLFHRIGHAALGAHGRLDVRQAVGQQGQRHHVIVQQQAGHKTVFPLQLLAQAAVIGAVGHPLAHFQIRLERQNISEHAHTSALLSINEVNWV